MLTDGMRRLDEGIRITLAIQSLLREAAGPLHEERRLQRVTAVRRMSEYCREHSEVVVGCEDVQKALEPLLAGPSDPDARSQLGTAVDALAASLHTARAR
jgi:hypothetical protein